MKAATSHTSWHVDSCDQKRLRGWVSILNEREPAHVMAYVDNDLVAEGRAEHFRPDLLAAGKARGGACAFDLPMSMADVRVDGKMLNIFIRRGYVPVMFASALVPEGPPVVLPQMPLWLARFIQPVARPLLRSFAIRAHGIWTNSSSRDPSFPVRTIISDIYSAIIGREIDGEALEFYLREISTNSDIRSYVGNLIASPEFAAVSTKSQDIRNLARRAQLALERLLETGNAALKLPPIQADNIPLVDLVRSMERTIETVCLLTESRSGLYEK